MRSHPLPKYGKPHLVWGLPTFTLLKASKPGLVATFLETAGPCPLEKRLFEQIGGVNMRPGLTALGTHDGMVKGRKQETSLCGVPVV